MRERLILCGGLKEKGASSKNSISLDVNASRKSSARVNLEFGDISGRMVENVPAVLADLLEVAAYVYCADQFTRRGGPTMPQMGANWRRQFRFRIPVRNLDFWKQTSVRETLIETLSFLSDDDYDFEFAAHPNPASPGLQPYFDLRGSSQHGFVPDDVILFSGGLDSFAGAVENLFGRDRKVALISHQSSAIVASRQSYLVGALRERAKKNRLFHVPVVVNKGKEEAVDTNQRSRSFLFATLGLVVARLFGRNCLQFYENGIVSTNLPVASHVLGTRATRTTHPKVLADFQKLFSMVLDEPVTVENPHFWKTKTDVVKLIAEHDCADLIRETFSCTRVRGALKEARHCGLCSQCIDRRFGILGASLADHEPSTAYGVDIFRGERKAGADTIMAESYVLHALKLASMSEAAFYSNFGQAFRVIPYLPGSAEENGPKLHALHRRHGKTVEEVIDGELARHARLKDALSLPQSSLLTLIQSSAVRLPPILDLAETEPSASEQASADSTQAIARPLIFAIDTDRKKVLFRGGVEITGAGFELIAALAVQFAEDVKSERAPAEFSFVKTASLSARLGLPAEALRQRVIRCRRNLERLFLEALDVQLSDDEVVQNNKWHGYRLNPYLLRVEPVQLRNVGPAGDVTTRNADVTTRHQDP